MDFKMSGKSNLSDGEVEMHSFACITAMILKVGSGALKGSAK